MKTAGPLEPLLDEVNVALSNGLYYLAVMLSLALPDICAALERPDGRTNSEYYKKWYDKHLADKFDHLSADDCYSLRCGVLHQGKIGVQRKGAVYDRVLFLIRDNRGNIFGIGKLSVLGQPSALPFDKLNFCGTIAEAVRDRFIAKQSSQNVQSNLPNLFQYRPNGLAPYIVGLPLLA